MQEATDRGQPDEELDNIIRRLAYQRQKNMQAQGVRDDMIRREKLRILEAERRRLKTAERKKKTRRNSKRKNRS